MSSQPKIDAFVIFREQVSRNTFYSPFPLTAPRLTLVCALTRVTFGEIKDKIKYLIIQEEKMNQHIALTGC
jgi:hypothetical protein